MAGPLRALMRAVISAFRSLRRHWRLALISAFSLSIAMALGIIALSISNAALLLRPSTPDPDRLLMIHDRTNTEPVAQVSYPDYLYYRRNSHSFTDVAAAPNSIGVSIDLNFNGRGVTVLTRPVSDNYFAVLGVRPSLGRFFAPGDDQNDAHIAVMTWSCWKRLGSDRQIVGKTIANYTIVGVSGQGFTAGFYGFEGDLFTNFRAYDDSPWRTDRMQRRLNLTARLRPGATREQAQAELATLSKQLASAYPRENQGRNTVITRATLLPPDAIPTAQWMVAILIVLVLLVLLIACTNVANLLLAVAVGRRQEAAIKLALGAPRGRLIREFLVESTLLCATGSLFGYAIAAAVIARFSQFTVVLPNVGPVSFGLHLKLDTTVAIFAVLLTAIASLATGLSPAFYASSPALASMLGGEVVAGGTRKQARRNVLVAVQVAVCTLVLIGMGLCQRNLYNLRHSDLGFTSRNLMTNTVYTDLEGHSGSHRAEFQETLRNAVAATPGVEAVTLCSEVPLVGADQVPVQSPDGAHTLSIHHSVVDAAYFNTFGIPIVAGRAFQATDRGSGPLVAIVNGKLAETLWPGQDAVGKTLTVGEPAQSRRYTVVGIAKDGKYVELDESPQPFFYQALTQHDQGVINVVARTKGDPRFWTETLSRTLRGLGMKIRVQPATFESWISLNLITDRIAAGFVSVLSALGLLLAVIGLFGAISYSVSERKKELGIRVALGALPWQLLRLILRQTLWIAGTGVAVGTLLGIAATSLFRSQLYGISPVEWIVLLPVGAAMLALSLSVAALSARPWLAVDPMEAVRHG